MTRLGFVENRGRRVDSLLLALPGILALFLLFVAPLLILSVYSFLTSTLFEVSRPFTLDNYMDAVSSQTVRILAWNSFVIGVMTAVACTAIALPVAYWLRYTTETRRKLVLALLTAALLASYLVRIYAWRSILGASGLINTGLERLGLIDEPLGFLLYNRFAVIVALTHIFLPYVILVLYSGFAPISVSLLEAAQDLGAGSFLRWRRLVLPLIAAPAAAAFLFVFVLSAGDYVTPQLLGGTNGIMLGVTIQNEFKADGDLAGGSAIALLVLLTFALCYAVTALGLRIARLDRITWST